MFLASLSLMSVFMAISIILLERLRREKKRHAKCVGDLFGRGREMLRLIRALKEAEVERDKACEVVRQYLAPAIGPRLGRDMFRGPGGHTRYVLRTEFSASLVEAAIPHGGHAVILDHITRLFSHEIGEALKRITHGLPPYQKPTNRSLDGFEEWDLSDGWRMAYPPPSLKDTEEMRAFEGRNVLRFFEEQDAEKKRESLAEEERG